MAEKPLSINTIDTGRLVGEVDQALEDLKNDILGRPGILKKRKLTIQIELSHSYTASNEKIIPRVGAIIKKSLPPYTSDEAIGTIRNNKIFLNGDFPKEPFQDSLYPEEGNPND